MARVAIVASVACLVATSAFAQSASVKVANQSEWEVHHIFLSSSVDEQWGPDQLEDNVLTRGDSLTLTSIPCDMYDVKVVDEDGDECIIEEVDLCRDNSYWKITNTDLLRCEGFQ